MFRISLIIITLAVFLGCTKEQKEQQSENKKTDTSVNNTDTQVTNSGKTTPEEFNFDYFGNYVDASYKDRTTGADWVAFEISPYDNGRVTVSVRSRADKMKPTCTYDGIASVVGSDELNIFDNMGTIKLKFSGKDLTVSAGEGSQEALLTYYCRGGGSLAGTYEKIDQQLDQSQVDKTAYTKTLSMKGSDIEFFI
ncbi:MAG: hypothetical protein KDD00_15715 [Ignavibacteriae bacterium]|nr:hypothetical protein [Ignavibacteriota bacterium]